MAKQYFKNDAAGFRGFFYYEVVADWVIRQVVVKGSRYIWSDESGESDADFPLCDQPLSRWDPLPPEISSEEFELV